ncbi:PREDICTED: small ubiquitin-related modifier-like [Diuraphis noxia]|uniref:small ubiquitin-related modifier-like n=1 Tax=Diuraphis noxia TaxID=143948 RepID=UPI0007638EDF|nr:PREDICTED: small ubiquitin-related modifier-like [Diuraphis noxia]
MACSSESSQSLPSKSKTDTIESPKVDDNVTSSGSQIQIRVITCDLTNEVHFRLKTEVAMVRLKTAYCKKMGHQVDEIRFVFDGHRITDCDTPKSLGMKDNDVIEVYQERTGGGM